MMQSRAMTTAETSPVLTERPCWVNARRVVIKIGSALLTDQATGAVNMPWLMSLADDVAGLIAEGREIIIVSSGAIAIGRHTLGLKSGSLKLDDSQAAAAAGQISLAHAYQTAFAPKQLTTAQILLTLSDTETRRNYLNARSTMSRLIGLGAVPVVNENDTVATSEIRYGDNDRLAARVATMMSADILILLSDIDGLYTAPPNTNSNATHISEVMDITPEIEAMAGDAGTGLSRGGMVTKITAAKIATRAGTNMIICSGTNPAPISALRHGARHTWFSAATDPTTARKRWIAGSLKPEGYVTIDDGAADALRKGKSLLPAGVTSVFGNFDRGDSIAIHDPSGEEIGRGLSAYDAEDARKIMGLRSNEIEEALNYPGRPALIHRDDLVMR